DSILLSSLRRQPPHSRRVGPTTHLRMHKNRFVQSEANAALQPSLSNWKAWTWMVDFDQVPNLRFSAASRCSCSGSSSSILDLKPNSCSIGQASALAPNT